MNIVQQFCRSEEFQWYGLDLAAISPVLANYVALLICHTQTYLQIMYLAYLQDQQATSFISLALPESRRTIYSPDPGLGSRLLLGTKLHNFRQTSTTALP